MLLPASVLCFQRPASWFRPGLLCCLSLWMAFTACQAPAEPDSPTRPNILFIMSDDHTAQAWGLYGGPLASLVKNDHIKRLAEEGCLLENAFCTNSICVPSRATILTGQYSHLNGVYTLSDPLEPHRVHVAHHLKEQGYQTAIIGKWHLRTRPQGFDHYNVLPGQGRYQNPILKDATNWEQGGREYEGFSSDVIGDLSVDWLKERTKDQPFFLMCHFKATHEPFDFPERHQSLYEDVAVPEPDNLLVWPGKEGGRTFQGQVLEILANRYLTNTQRYPEPQLQTGIADSVALRKATYQKFVKDFMRSGAAIDDNIGKLLAYLDEAGLAENTVVIYTADQGYFLGEHGMFDKRMMYEEPLRMPFVVRYPPEIPAGSRLDDMVLNVDFAPLFLDYAGGEVPASMQGRSFRSNLQGNTPEGWRESMYYRYWLHLQPRPAHFGIRTDRYKLLFLYGQPLGMTGADTVSTAPSWEFYDLEKDPHENVNAYDDPTYQAVIAQLKQQLLDARKQVEDTDEAHPEMQALIEGEF